MSWLFFFGCLLQVKGLRSLYNRAKSRAGSPTDCTDPRVPGVQLKATTAPATTNCYRKLSREQCATARATIYLPAFLPPSFPISLK